MKTSVPMAPQRKKFYDLNVPLTLSSTASPSSRSWTRKQLAHIYQTRLHQLGYSSIAFCHTAYGRVDAKKDDADAVLPWRDVISDSLIESETASTKSPGKRRKDDQSCLFGRENALGMSIYRRINIVLEEVSDVSRLLLPSQSASSVSQSTLSLDEMLQKYDIVSLQPMNEPTLQNICELITSFGNDKCSSNTATIPSKNVDVIVLEYATGSRGGYGLPYKMRKDYLVKTMEAGVTFELCYASAVIDPKRRQGFLRTLVDFQSCYNSVQKKHMLLNKNIFGLRIDGDKCKSELFPLLISSGSRQNYSLGTDEGILALHTPKDVHFLAGHTTGGKAWLEKNELFEETRDKQKGMVVLSAAEKILRRARDRSLGVLTSQSITGNQKKRRNGAHSNSNIRAYVRAISTTKIRAKLNRNDEDESDSDDSSVENTSRNILEWLSEPINTDIEGDPNGTEINHHDTAKGEEVSATKENALRDEVIEGGFKEDDDEDLEDGFLAL
ncbi:hypothetical protein HJC23_012356 [Cyclotella cryptica]|uniref:Uncharacterized protein n=1 Tax=Cyclotella cryptica TaxID=29204 RepID=A0ABD3QCE2_9STRA|eukprot:CCRYP_006562-RA/>CCRYP_006562-RA protein AED:0.06 eAED:-0.06 QI:0/-1/0/1/-1/1/1/0/497